MKYLQVIELCCAPDDQLEVESLLQELSNQPVFCRMHIYQNALVKTEYSVHLHYEKDGYDLGKCVEGEQIAASLKSFGIVNDTIWLQRDETH